MKFIAKVYQEIIIAFMLKHLRANIHAGMGVGKTVSALTVADALILAGMEDKPTLILAPLRVASSTWPAEGKKWDHLSGMRIRAIVGSAAERREALKDRRANVFTINYENVVWLLDELKGEFPFGTVIADESTRLKSYRGRGGGKRAAALGKIAFLATRWYNLTGTPAPNGLQDLWGQMWFIDKGQRLGRTYGAFTGRWFNKIQMGPNPAAAKLQIKPHSADEIHAAIKDVTLSIQYSDYYPVDEPLFIPVPVYLPADARRHYDELQDELFTVLQGNQIEAMNPASLTIKCIQAASGALYTDDKGNFAKLHDEKLDALGDLLDELNQPVIVAYHFKSDLARLKERFPHAVQLDADPKTQDRWNAGKIPLMLAHPQSAGHGLNLQDGGCVLVIFTPWWDLEAYQQIIERIGPTRQMQAGHPRPVYVYALVAEDTLDEVVVKRRDGKGSVQDALMEAMKGHTHV